MKLYSTTDVSASVHRAAEQFTHVVLNRVYTLHRPVFFDSSPLVDLPLFQYASWLPSDTQITKWQEKGGVLISQVADVPWECDVTVTVECPLSLIRIDHVLFRTKEYGVLPNPVSWTAYDEYVDLHTPTVEHLREIWTACGGQNMTNGELARESGWPIEQVMFMKTCLKPKEHWCIQKRLAPEREELIPAWDWLEGGCVPRSVISAAGHRPAVEELAKFGYIGLKKLQHYPAEEPNWKQLKRNREQALKDLSAVRSLVESLPDHLSA